MIDSTINDDKTIAGGEDMFLAGRYHILRRLGQGGMGAVWLAEDRQLDNRKVAIKMLPSIVVTDKRAYQQLKSEALVSLKLIHPNIVTLRAFEENNGAPFLVMDYIEGRTLSDYLAEKGKLSESETIKLLKPIAAALDYAHGEKVIHRDVKPSNIIIRKDGHPFILDFGIAREIQESMTRVTGRTISGTLLYMSPEQLRGAPPAPAQDVYSFAAMVYECLKGEPPFAKGDIAYQIVNVLPVPLKGDLGVAKFIMQGLHKNPESRPKSCLEVVMANGVALDELLPNSYNPVLTLRVALLLTVLIAIFGGAWWLLKGNCLSRQDKSIRKSGLCIDVPKGRSSLSNLDWTYYQDAYYEHSNEERQKELAKKADKDRRMADWAIVCLAGADGFKETDSGDLVWDDASIKEFSSVNDAIRNGDYLLANKLLNEIFDIRNSAYQFFSGVLSECRNDIKAAHRWYQLAAEDWCKEALFNLGVFYEFGVCVKADAELAAGYYQRAAIQGDKEALQRWQKLSGSNATVPDLKLMPVFERKPWPDKSVLVKGTEFAALRDDVGRWWDVPFSRVKDFFEANNNQVDGKFFFNTGAVFINDENDTVEHVGRHFEINRDQICNFEERDAWPAVEVWDGKKMHFVKANDIQAARNIVLYYILVTGKDAFTDLNSGGKYEQLVTSEMKKEIANRNDGNSIIPIYKLMTDELLLISDKR